MELKNRKKNKDQGMQKLYFPKTSRGNKAGLLCFGSGFPEASPLQGA